MTAVIIMGFVNVIVLTTLIMIFLFNGLHIIETWNITLIQMNNIIEAILIAFSITFGTIAVFITPLADIITPFFSGARKMIPSERTLLEDTVDKANSKFAEFLNKQKIKLNIMIKDSPELNMAAVGRHTVIINRGFYESFENEIIEGVVSHELSHLYNKDSLYSCILWSMMGITFILLSILIFITCTSYAVSRFMNNGYLVFIGLFLQVIAALAGAIFLMYAGVFIIFNMFIKISQRKKELRADKEACIAGYSEELKFFLENIKNTDYQKKNIIKKLFNTHPKVIVRIGRIETFNEA